MKSKNTKPPPAINCVRRTAMFLPPHTHTLKSPDRSNKGCILGRPWLMSRKLYTRPAIWLPAFELPDNQKEAEFLQMIGLLVSGRLLCKEHWILCWGKSVAPKFASWVELGLMSPNSTIEWPCLCDTFWERVLLVVTWINKHAEEWRISPEVGNNPGKQNFYRYLLSWRLWKLKKLPFRKPAGAIYCLLTFSAFWRISTSCRHRRRAKSRRKTKTALHQSGKKEQSHPQLAIIHHC